MMFKKSKILAILAIVTVICSFRTEADKLDWSLRAENCRAQYIKAVASGNKGLNNKAVHDSHCIILPQLLQNCSDNSGWYKFKYNSVYKGKAYINFDRRLTDAQRRAAILIHAMKFGNKNAHEIASLYNEVLGGFSQKIAEEAQEWINYVMVNRVDDGFSDRVGGSSFLRADVWENPSDEIRTEITANGKTLTLKKNASDPIVSKNADRKMPYRYDLYERRIDGSFSMLKDKEISCDPYMTEAIELLSPDDVEDIIKYDEKKNMLYIYSDQLNDNLRTAKEQALEILEKINEGEFLNAKSVLIFGKNKEKLDILFERLSEVTPGQTDTNKRGLDNVQYVGIVLNIDDDFDESYYYDNRGCTLTDNLALFTSGVLHKLNMLDISGEMPYDMQTRLLDSLSDKTPHMSNEAKVKLQLNDSKNPKNELNTARSLRQILNNLPENSILQLHMTISQNVRESLEDPNRSGSLFGKNVTLIAVDYVLRYLLLRRGSA